MHPRGFPRHAHVYVSTHWHAAGVGSGPQKEVLLENCDGICIEHVSTVPDGISMRLNSTVPPSKCVQVGAESATTSNTLESIVVIESTAVSAKSVAAESTTTVPESTAISDASRPVSTWPASSATLSRAVEAEPPQPNDINNTRASFFIATIVAHCHYLSTEHLPRRTPWLDPRQFHPLRTLCCNFKSPRACLDGVDDTPHHADAPLTRNDV